MSNTDNIIKRYKDELQKSGITPNRIIKDYVYEKDGVSEHRTINLIIVSDDFKGIDVCKRLEMLAHASRSISERIEAIGYTVKEIKKTGRDSWIAGVLACILFFLT